MNFQPEDHADDVGDVVERVHVDLTWIVYDPGDYGVRLFCLPGYFPNPDLPNLSGDDGEVLTAQMPR